MDVVGTVSLLLDPLYHNAYRKTYIRDEVEKDKLFNAIETTPVEQQEA